MTMLLRPAEIAKQGLQKYLHCCLVQKLEGLGTESTLRSRHPIPSENGFSSRGLATTIWVKRASWLGCLRSRTKPSPQLLGPTDGAMWRRDLLRLNRPWFLLSRRSSSSVSSAVDSMLLRSLKDHYLEVSKMTPPPKVSPPSPFSIIKGALDGNGPVLNRSYGDEEIRISVMRMANFVAGGAGEEDADDDINQLFLHVDVSKPTQTHSLHFLCGLYPDALGIHSVSMRPKEESSGIILLPSGYTGPSFQDLDEKMRDGFHNYIEERGVNENLFLFLRAWLYVKDHRNLMRWFKSVGTFINEHKSGKED